MRVVAIAIVLLLAACSREAPPPPAVRPVQLHQVSAGGVADTSVFAGEVKPRHEADLAFRIGGKIVERRVDVGAGVRRGQPLARLDPVDVGLQAQAAEAAAAAARTEADFARAELERYEDLYRQKFVSESALDQKRNAMLTASARLAQAQANLAVTRNQAAYATLVAPDDGVITAIGVEVGQVVAAGQPVMKLARTDEREVAIAVPESRVEDLKRAQRLQVVLLAHPGRVYQGRVREIAPAADPVTRTFAARIAVPDADPSLGWGMTANVVAIAPGARDALVPLSSIYHAPDGKPAVWIYNTATNKVTLRSVELGPFREDGAIVTSGLSGGEWIVAAGVNKLQEGQTVRPYEAPGRASPPASAAAEKASPPVATR